MSCVVWRGWSAPDGWWAGIDSVDWKAGGRAKVGGLMAAASFDELPDEASAVGVARIVADDVEVWFERPDWRDAEKLHFAIGDVVDRAAATAFQVEWARDALTRSHPNVMRSVYLWPTPTRYVQIEWFSSGLPNEGEHDAALDSWYERMALIYPPCEQVSIVELWS